VAHGLPCVTGVSAVTELVHAADVLTAAGYLDIVVIG